MLDGAGFEQALFIDYVRNLANRAFAESVIGAGF
jgi:hypothetical protein